MREDGIDVALERSRTPGCVTGHPLNAAGAALQSSLTLETVLEYLRIEAGADAPLRILLIGGTPLGESIVMWWNFIGRDHDEIVAFREQWQGDVIDDTDRAGRFGHVDGYEGAALPAPALPGIRLKPRE